MPFTSIDEQNLKSRGLLRAYRHHRQDFIEISRIAYQALVQLVTPPPDVVGMEVPLAAALGASKLFRRVIARYDPYVAFGAVTFVELSQALARYMLSKDWNDIKSP